MYTTKIKASTQKGQAIINDLSRHYYGDIYDAYERPSRDKVHAYERIAQRARETEGYNYDLHIVGRSCHMFSTIYSVSNADGSTSIIKDTRDNVYEVVI